MNLQDVDWNLGTPSPLLARIVNGRAPSLKGLRLHVRFVAGKVVGLVSQMMALPRLERLEVQYHRSYHTAAVNDIQQAAKNYPHLTVIVKASQDASDEDDFALLLEVQRFYEMQVNEGKYRAGGGGGGSLIPYTTSYQRSLAFKSTYVRPPREHCDPDQFDIDHDLFLYEFKHGQLGGGAQMKKQNKMKK